MTYFVLNFDIVDNKGEILSFLLAEENGYAIITIENGVASIDFFRLYEDGNSDYQDTTVYSLANIQKITFKNLKSIDWVIEEMSQMKEGK